MKKDFKRKLTIGFSIGDVNGIGPEILLKSLINSDIMKYCIPVVFCDESILKFYKNLYGYKINISRIKNSNQSFNDETLYCFNNKKITFEIELGKVNKASGDYSVHSLLNAVNFLKEKKIEGLVTLPINKENSQSKDFKFPGHTEFLENSLNSKESMMIMYSNKMILGLVSGHIPLIKITDYLNSKIISNKIQLFLNTLEKDFKIKNPKIALLGINPHSGENGLLGSEEIDIIDPLLIKFNKKKKILFGPYPADSFFGLKKYSDFDGILSFYHDQGLIGFKTVSFEDGVNYTAGLPYVRTSPDHGTAYNISGKGIASEISLTESIKLNIKILNNRRA